MSDSNPKCSGVSASARSHNNNLISSLCEYLGYNPVQERESEFSKAFQREVEAHLPQE